MGSDMTLWYIAPIASLIALAVAAAFFRSMKKADPGDGRMREIAGYGGDISRFVPAEILDDLMKKLNGRK